MKSENKAMQNKMETEINNVKEQINDVKEEMKEQFNEVKELLKAINKPWTMRLRQTNINIRFIEGQRIIVAKSIDLLVPVSWRHCCPYTSGLSTW